MKKRKSPQLKKQDSYDKDFRPHLENPHAFRKNWSKKKSRANRRQRAAIRSLVDKDGGADVTPAKIKAFRRGQWKIIKSGIVTLRQRIKDNRNTKALLANSKSARISQTSRD